jgi:hypothetical protein
MHVDRAACAWLIQRRLDPKAVFVFVNDPEELPVGATAFDMRGVELSHHGDDCSFETMLRHFDLVDPVLWDMARIVHEADLADEAFDAPAARGLDAVFRGLSMVQPDEAVLAIAAAIFDGLYEYHRRSLLLGREPG